MQYNSFEIVKMLKKAREKKNFTKEELVTLVKKMRAYLSRIENNGTSINLKTLQEIVEVGLGGKIKIKV